MRTLLLCIICLLPFNLNAAMYKWIDENGEVVYSDEPPHEGAEELIPPGLTTTPAIKYQPKQEPVKKEPPQINYTQIAITQPGQDEHIRDNEGNIPVAIAITPPLNTAEGHYLVIKINGEILVPKLTSLATTINNVNRGTNIITVSVHDKTGKELKTSGSVTVYMHRYSKLFPKPR